MCIQYVDTACGLTTFRVYLLGSGTDCAGYHHFKLRIVIQRVCMQSVLGFAGVVVVIMAYILPGIMLVKMDLHPMHRVIGVVYVIFGVLVGTLSFIEQVIKLMDPTGGS